MKTVTVTRSNSVSLMSQLWTPLPEFQQEALSGGAPKLTSISNVIVAGIAGASSIVGSIALGGLTVSLKK